MLDNRTADEELMQLLSDIRSGKDTAFSQLVSVYEGLLRSQVARFAKDGAEAADVYQEACLALYRAALGYRPREHVTFGLYAKVCVGNALKTRYKRIRRAPSDSGKGDGSTLPLDEEQLSEPFADPVEEKERLDELLSVIDAELSSYERKVFALYINDLSVAEIAKELGRSEKSIRNAETRLLAKLRNKLGR